MDIQIYPAPVLRKVAPKVEAFDQDLTTLADQMLTLMYQAKGVGLAAPQVGVSLRLFVYNPSGKKSDTEGEKVIINPKILKRSGQKADEEGCLSFPGIYAEITRPKWILFEAQDMEGKSYTAELEGYEARVFQHELDHLEGILFVNRVEPTDRMLLRKPLESMETEYKESRASDQ